MKRSSLALSLLAVLAAGAALAGGPLEPPADGVRPTMKPLDQIEPRIALSADNTPGDEDSIFRIAKPGSYYLTGNLIGEEGKAGIEIAASNVTLDLMGYTVRGVQGSLQGVTTDGPQVSLVIRNGVVSHWGGDGVHLAIASEELSGACLVEKILVTSNSGHGLNVGIGSIVRECIATANRNDGIVADAASLVESCVARHNAHGIRVADHSNVRACQALGNLGIGIFAGPECTISDSAARGNQADGFHLQHGGTILDSTATANIGDGFLVRNGVVRGCTARADFRGGINAIGKCVVEGNTAEDTEYGAGIRVFGDGSRVKGNTVSGCEIGMDVQGTNNFIVSNVVSLSGRASFHISGSNRVGPIVEPAKSAEIAGQPGSGGLGSTDPWANFAY